jgi:hypothetical protein
MKNRERSPTLPLTLTLTLALLALAAIPACGGEESSVEASITHADGSKPTADDREATDFVRSKIAEHWVEGSDGWTTELQQKNLFGQVMPGIPAVRFHQVRSVSFTLQPESLTEAQKLNGADYRAQVTFTGTPERHYRTQETYEGPPGWSKWSDGWDRYLAIERRDGKWLIQDSEWFDGILPSASEIPSGK